MTQPLLVIGNKTYSSWSLRAWIGLASLDVPFQEVPIALDRPETEERIRQYSPAGLVPVLVEGDLIVHESLAILEYVNERYGEGRLLPGDMKRRAEVRAVAAEMHAGFPAIRRQMPMHLRRAPAPLPDTGPWAPTEAVRTELHRLLGLWEHLRQRHKDEGDFLFGAWTLADCMYLPMATRLVSYAVALGNHPLAAAYVQTLWDHPAFQPWLAAARQETEVFDGMPP